MMYDLLRALYIDLGNTSDQIASKVKPDLPFKSLFTKEMPAH